MSQYLLFPVDALPDGFLYQPDFLSAAEEQELLAEIQALDFKAFDFHGYKARRRVVMYGWDYDFNSHKVSVATPLPDFLLPLRERCAVLINLPARAIVEAVVTEYPAGAPIGWHRDVPQFETILGVSLLGTCRMRLRPYNAPGKTISVTLEPRSAYVISGKARWGYQHSIPPVTGLRYSITFRTLREDLSRKTG